MSDRRRWRKALRFATGRALENKMQLGGTLFLSECSVGVYGWYQAFRPRFVPSKGSATLSSWGADMAPSQWPEFYAELLLACWYLSDPGRPMRMSRSVRLLCKSPGTSGHL